MQILAFDGACRSRYSGHADPKVGDEVFVMKLESDIRQLAKLAKDRQLPLLPEQAWWARTGVNPVKLAIEYVDTVERRRNTLCFAAFNITLGVAGCLVLFYLMLITPDTVGMTAFAAEKCQLDIIRGVSLLILSVGIVGCGCCGITFGNLRLPDKKEAELFWSEYRTFCAWVYSPECDRILFEPQELKAAAREVLLVIAFKVIKFPEPGPQTSKMEWNAYTSLWQEMNVKFDVLSRLGLTVGNPKTYCEEARKLRRQEERKAQPPAI